MDTTQRNVCKDQYIQAHKVTASTIRSIDKKPTDLAAVTQICQNWLQRPLPILVHSYDYLIPDGRGFLGGWTFLPGPWLEPGFRDKGFDQLEDRKTLAKQLIDVSI